MKRKTRRLLFYFAVIVFAILGYLVALFALGYQYDFVQNKFFKTGVLQVNTNRGAEVYINDELAGQTSFLTNSFSKSRLLPRAYTVRIQQDGYQIWQKLITIEAERFTHFPKVTLLPKELPEQIVASTSITGPIKAGFIADQKRVLLTGSKSQTEIFDLTTGQKIKPNGKKAPTAPSQPASQQKNEDRVLLESPDGEKALEFNSHEIWVEWIKDAGYQPYKKTGERGLITRFAQSIHDVQWYKDSAHVIADIGGVLKLIEIDDRDGINIMDIALSTGVFYYDKGMNAIFKLDGKNIIKIGLDD